MAAGGWNWDVAAVVTVVGWLLSPIITLLLPKIFSCLGFDASHKLRELEIRIIPELQQTMRAVDEERMVQREKKLKCDVAALDKMAAMLRHALEDTEDIFDDAQDKIVLRCCHSLYHAVASCIARFKTSCSWIARNVHTKSARLVQWAPKISLCIAGFKTSCAWIVRSGSARLQQCARKISLRGSEDVLPMTASAAPLGEPAPVVTSVVASNGPVPVATNAAHSDSSWIWLSCWYSLFGFCKNYCRSTFYWLVHAIEFARFYRDWSYDVVGITSYQENATALDFVLTAILRRKLKKRIEKVESIISEVKKSPLFRVASNNAPNDIANKNRSRIRASSKQKVFGRELLRDDIMARLRETPQGDAPRSSPCYSVIGLYGIAGSGKTTFAGYIRDYIKKECKEKLFDAIMCIHVSETFSVDDIFHDMLKDITKDRHSNISDHEELEEKLKEALRGKRFFLILDDLWVKKSTTHNWRN
ncbi:hypothetical protein VPH35_005551 [Triticum aestivum]